MITSTIRPRIDGVRINPVALTSTHPGRVLYVVYIPQSKRPHQANDHRFYKRFNFKAAPMEEYEIWDVARRNEAPDLNLTFNLWKPGLVPHGEYIDVDQPGGKARLFSLLNNTSDEPAFYIDIRILLDPRFNVPDAAGLTHIGNRLIGAILMNVYQSPWSVPSRMPVWNGSDYGIGPITVSLPSMDVENYMLAWQLRSPKMKLKEGLAHLRCNGVGVAIDEYSPSPTT